MNIKMVYAVVVMVIAIAVGPLARADKQASPGNSVDRGAYSGRNDGPQVYFTDDRVTSIRQYYANDHGAGNCPPGLAKKNNGCLPPGQAKQWRRGEPLPRGTVYYELPGDLMVVLGDVPPGRKVVRVDEDLLLISIATGLVLEVLEL